MEQAGGTPTFFQKQKLLREKALQAQKSTATAEIVHHVEDAVMTDASVSDSPASNIQQTLPAAEVTMSPAAPTYTPSSQVETGAPAPATSVVKRGPHHVASDHPSVPSGARRVASGPLSALHSRSPPVMHPLEGEGSTPKRPAGPHAQRTSNLRHSEATARTEPAVSPTVSVVTEHAHPTQQVDEDQPMTEQAHSVQQADDDQSMTETVSVTEDESTLVNPESVFAAQHVPEIQHAHAAEPIPSTELALLTKELAATQAPEANENSIEETKSTNGTTSNGANSKAIIVHQTNDTGSPESDWVSLFLNLQHLPEARPAIRAYLKALEARLTHLDKTGGPPSLTDKRFPFTLKLSTGQQLPANVLGGTTVAEIIEEIGRMTLAGEEQCTISVTTIMK